MQPFPGSLLGGGGWAERGREAAMGRSGAAAREPAPQTEKGLRQASAVKTTKAREPAREHLAAISA